MTGVDEYTDQARLAVLAAARTEHDFAGWLANVLARVAAELGSSDALTAGRPGSCEGALVPQLTKGTVRWEAEYFDDYMGPLR